MQQCPRTEQSTDSLQVHTQLSRVNKFSELAIIYALQYETDKMARAGT